MTREVFRFDPRNADQRFDERVRLVDWVKRVVSLRSRYATGVLEVAIIVSELRTQRTVIPSTH